MNADFFKIGWRKKKNLHKQNTRIARISRDQKIIGTEIVDHFVFTALEIVFTKILRIAAQSYHLSLYQSIFNIQIST